MELLAVWNNIFSSIIIVFILSIFQQKFGNIAITFSMQDDNNQINIEYKKILILAKLIC